MEILIFRPVFHIKVGPFDLHNQLFQADQTRIAEGYCHKYETDYIDDPATEVENFLVGFNKCNQLIIIHRHAESKVNPFYRFDLQWLSPHAGQLNSEIDVLNHKNTH